VLVVEQNKSANKLFADCLVVVVNVVILLNKRLILLILLLLPRLQKLHRTPRLVFHQHIWLKYEN